MESASRPRAAMACSAASSQSAFPVRLTIPHGIVYSVPIGMVRIFMAGAAQRETIYRLRHEIYARELHQHEENEGGAVRDALDDGNIYIVAAVGDDVAGFVSITSPRQGRYSIDKYLRRDRIPVLI